MTKLPERDLRNLVALSGLEVKAVPRLLGSLRVPNPKPGVSGMAFLDIGLRLDAPEVTARMISVIGKDRMIDLFAEALRAYLGACPAICRWVGRGDFAVDRIPETVSKANLLHACRTAGRLRAQCVRNS
ncbi:MAG: hypothetical protein K1X79_14290 [Oligoflexia bacterium]|nr:hypothetical protein [Oligoflexia bacterium]